MSKAIDTTVTVRDQIGRAWGVELLDEADSKEVANLLAHWPIPALKVLATGVSNLLRMTPAERATIAKKAQAERDWADQHPAADHRRCERSRASKAK